MLKFCDALFKTSKSNIICNFMRINKYTTTVEVRKIQNISSESSDLNENKTIEKPNVVQQKRPNNNSTNNIVAAAFASLKSDTKTVSSEIETPITDTRINKATTINELLSISEGIGISRRHALQVVSILADWSAKQTVKLSDFETDPRFLKLCKVLTRSNKKEQQKNGSEDLNTILSVTADDEAAKLVASITLPQMVKVMSTLAYKKRRSISLLRSLAFNITRNSNQLDIKQSGDLLYSMAVLNFPDENLLYRITTDICKALDNNMKKSSIIGSILTSIGLLRYKNPEILETLSNWILSNHDISRQQDVCALILTLAMLNYEPSNASKLFEVIIPQIATKEVLQSNLWLDIVWSLLILNQATSEQIASVLNDDYVKNFQENSSASSKLKLLNINGAARFLIPNYDGPFLNTASPVNNFKLARTKEKQELVKSLLDSLKNLVQSENYLGTNIDTGMGFFIDAECVMDKKRNPVSLDNSSTVTDVTRIAFVAYDYPDLCIGKIEPSGINALTSKLLEAQGYNILTVPYNEFKATDKLIIRVQYLESKLKSLIKT